jgi:uncharacterized protein
VNNSNNPLRLNVGYLFNKSIGTSREIPVEFEHLELDDLSVQNLKSSVKVSRTREGLLLQVKGAAKVEANCVRCLVDYYQPVTIEFEELYQFPSRHREATDLVLPNDGYLDLRPLYREYLILGIPIKPLCNPDCKGLCIVCGVNLNEETCEHEQNARSSSDIVEGEEAV